MVTIGPIPEDLAEKDGWGYPEMKSIGLREKKAAGMTNRRSVPGSETVRKPQTDQAKGRSRQAQNPVSACCRAALRHDPTYPMVVNASRLRSAPQG